MKSHLFNNESKFEFVFFDSPTRFDEDLENTLQSFNKDTLNKSSFEDLMFTLHVRINLLKPILDNSEVVLSGYSLEGYGNGPQYDDDNLYYIPSGTFNLVSSESNHLEFRSADSLCSLFISIDDLEFFTNRAAEEITEQGLIEIDNWLSMPIFIRSDKQDELINKLLLDLNQLNNLYRDLAMKDKIIEL